MGNRLRKRIDDYPPDCAARPVIAPGLGADREGDCLSHGILAALTGDELTGHELTGHELTGDELTRSTTPEPRAFHHRKPKPGPPLSSRYSRSVSGWGSPPGAISVIASRQAVHASVTPSGLPAPCSARISARHSCSAAVSAESPIRAALRASSGCPADNSSRASRSAVSTISARIGSTSAISIHQW